MEIVDAKGNKTWIEHDEGPARVNYDKIPKPRPAFDVAGAITAANASTLNDGACVEMI